MADDSGWLKVTRCNPVEWDKSIFERVSMVKAGQPTYVLALAQLQKALNSSTEALRSETQAAAFLLCTYEVCA